MAEQRGAEVAEGINMIPHIPLLSVIIPLSSVPVVPVVLYREVIFRGQMETLHPLALLLQMVAEVAEEIAQIIMGEMGVQVVGREQEEGQAVQVVQDRKDQMVVAQMLLTLQTNFLLPVVAERLLRVRALVVIPLRETVVRERQIP